MDHQKATCGAGNHHRPALACDRERGHAGDHRGYDPQIDEPMFWPNLADRGQGTDPDLLTTAEAAEQLRVSVETIRRYIRSKQLPAQRLPGGYRIATTALARVLSEP